MKPRVDGGGYGHREAALGRAEALFSLPNKEADSLPDLEAAEVSERDWMFDDNNHLSFREMPNPETGVESVRDIIGTDGNSGWKQDAMYDTTLDMSGRINGVDVSVSWNFDREEYDIVVAGRVDVLLGQERGDAEAAIEDLKALAGVDDGFLENVRAIDIALGGSGDTDHAVIDLLSKDERLQALVNERYGEQDASWNGEAGSYTVDTKRTLERPIESEELKRLYRTMPEVLHMPGNVDFDSFLEGTQYHFGQINANLVLLFWESFGYRLVVNEEGIDIGRSKEGALMVMGELHSLDNTDANTPEAILDHVSEFVEREGIEQMAPEFLQYIDGSDAHSPSDDRSHGGVDGRRSTGILQNEADTARYRAAERAVKARDAAPIPKKSWLKRLFGRE
ncbi:hypothetical protein HOI83_03530 [Candidatus Uhrbacteria bacterium]|jgi:hypothetical protein|nr:hypothetical protein [Candidatus Uhrbacteria bacterium]